MTTNEIERLVAKALADSDLPEEKALPFLEEFSERLSYMRRYLTHGGFIQDNDGKWCKDCDAIEVETTDGAHLSVYLRWDSVLKEFGFKFKRKFYAVNEFDFWLKEPCQPDICKDFKQ